MVAPTPVQAAILPPALAGRDVIAVAATGGGKTAAFALPLLQRLAPDPYGVHTLVLTPTRELAFQVGDQFAALGAGMTLDVCVCVGGLDGRGQAAALARRPHVVVATPGRLADLMATHADVRPAFARTAALVLDEADRLLDAGFEGELAAVASALPARRQTLLFSATMTESLVDMQKAVLRSAFTYRAYDGLAVAAGLDERYALVPAHVKDVYLVHLLQDVAADQGLRSAIVFVDSTKGCAALGRVADELGLATVCLHGGLPQAKRLAALDRRETD